jgi:hypothetical protein
LDEVPVDTDGERRLLVVPCTERGADELRPLLTEEELLPEELLPVAVVLLRKEDERPPDDV